MQRELKHKRDTERQRHRVREVDEGGERIMERTSMRKREFEMLNSFDLTSTATADRDRGKRRERIRISIRIDLGLKFL